MKRKSLRIFLGLEIALVAAYYLFGSYGLQVLRSADSYNAHLLEDIKKQESGLESLHRELDERKDNPFYKEMVARKELQMAYENEIIYIIDKKKVTTQEAAA